MKTFEQRFWAKVDKTPGHGPDGDCWVWTAYTSRLGYGRIRFQKTIITAHRISYWIQNPTWKLSSSLSVCHACDTPACVNPKHLWLGTQADNMKDCKGKGRKERGERHASARLTENQIIAIRQDSRIQKQIASDYGMGRTIISNIKSKNKWAHVID